MVPINDYIEKTDSERIFNLLKDVYFGEENIPYKMRPRYAEIIYDAGAKTVVPYDDYNERYDEFVSVLYSMLQLLNMIPKEIKVKKSLAVFRIYFENDKYTVGYWYKGYPFQIFNKRNSLGEDLVDAFIWTTRDIVEKFQIKQSYKKKNPKRLFGIFV